MSIDQYPKLQQINENGYSFEMGEYVNQGFKIVTQKVGSFIGYTLIYMIILSVLYAIPLIGFLAVYALSPILFAGFYIGAHHIAKGERLEFGDFFKGFDDALQLILWYVLFIIATGILMAPFFVGLIYGYFEWIADPEIFLENANPFAIFSKIPSWSLWLFIPVIYLSIAWRWAPMFIIFNRMNFWDAMEMSRRIITRKWWVQLGFSIVFSLIILVGFMVLGIGFLFTFPAALCMDYAAFAHVTRLHQEEMMANNIEEHLID